MWGTNKRIIAVTITVLLALTSISAMTSIAPGHTNVHSVSTNTAAKKLSPESMSPSNIHYNVTFLVSGLPSYVIWDVTFNGTQKNNYVRYAPIYANNISFNVTAGLYNYSISSYVNLVTTYTPSPQTGIVNVSNRNVTVNITYNPSPLIPWAFNGSYANYSISQQNLGGTQYGYSFYGINDVNESIGSYTTDFVRVIGQIHYPVSSSQLLEGYTWLLPIPLLRIPTLPLLSQINNGNSTQAKFIISQFLNIHSSIMPSNWTLKTGMLLKTDIGSFLTDEFSGVYSYVNGPSIAGSGFQIYFDQYSGMLLKYVSILNGNYTEKIHSTNIPMSKVGSRLVFDISPSGSEVSINGIALNLTSGTTTVFMSPGTYYISVSAQGHVPVFKQVNLAAGSTTYENLTLAGSKNTTFTISGHVNPADSSIVAGRYVANVDPLGNYSISLPSGSYTLSATANGYYPATHALNLVGNITNLNFTLSRESSPSSNYDSNNVSVEGFNVTVSNLNFGIGNISLSYKANTNGSLTIEVPYYKLDNFSLSDILGSRLYINGTQYTNFTVAISAQGGNYAVILSVKGLSKDPNLLWVISPSKSPQGTIFGINRNVLELISAVVVVAVIATTVFSLYRRKRP